MSAAREGPGELALDADAAMRPIERLGGGVLLEHPQVQPGRRPAPDYHSRCLGEQSGTDSPAFEVVPDMKVVEEGTPCRVSVEDGVSEACNGAVEISDYGESVQRGPREPAGPLGHPVRDDIAVEIRIQVCAPVVAPPAISVQISDGFRITRRRLPVVHTPMFADLQCDASPCAIALVTVSM
jgi:hypothetical protein